MKLEFILKFSRQDFEELYFQDSSEYESKLKKRKQKLQLLVGCGIVVSAFLFYAQTADHFFTSFVFVMIFLYTLYNYFKEYRDMSEYKRTIDKHLINLSKINVFTLVLTDSYLSVIADEKETIGVWLNFRQVFITNEYVSLVGESNFVIPAKSLSADEYSILKKFISEKFKNETEVLDDRSRNV